MIRVLCGIALTMPLSGCFAPENAQPVMAEQNAASTQTQPLFSGELKPGETVYIPVVPSPDQHVRRMTADGNK
jgi:hypothetical protein